MATEVENRSLAQRDTVSRRGIRAHGSIIASLLLCLLTITAFSLYSRQVWHWFILPLLLCGSLVGADAVDWVRGRTDLLDPVGVLGMVGTYFYFLAPLLHVAKDYWMTGVSAPPDWRPWLGAMAILNATGLLLYRWSRGRGGTSQAGLAAAQTGWRLDGHRYRLALAASLVLALITQLWVYRQFGGLDGYINSYETQDAGFTGMGRVFAISESFPVLAFMGFALMAQKRASLRSWMALLVALLALVPLRLFFGGLRGSRGNVVWALFWGLGIIHLAIRRVPRKVVLGGLIFLIGFMYVYGFYKSLGREGLVSFVDAEQRSVLPERTGRSLDSLLLGDFGRSDVQAFLLYRLLWPEDLATYAWGRTYLGAAALLVPRSLWSSRPPTVAKEGTEAQYGRGTWVPDLFASSRVYGLAGEAMLNFGPLGIPFSFVLLGLLVRKVRGWLKTASPSDPRLLLLPLAVNLCLVVLVSDSDNALFFLVKNGLMPTLVVFWSSIHMASTSVRR